MGLLAIGSMITKDPNTLIIDGGDTIQGSPFSSYVAENAISPNPIAGIMNHIGYDYITLGNHDFNYGYETLTAYLKDLNAAPLCGNVTIKKSSQKDLIHSTALHKTANGLKVGIIGLTTDFINVWEQKANLKHFHISDTFAAAKKLIGQIQEDADILVGIYHGGFEKDLESGQRVSFTSENIACKLCESFPFDLILTGHQHLPICNQTIAGTHIVQTPMNGTRLAKICISYDEEISQTHIESQLLVPDGLKLPSYSQDYDFLQRKVQDWLDVFIGHLDTDLVPQDHLSMALTGSPITNFLNQVQLEASGADISCTSLANKIMGLPKEVTLRHIVSTYIYPNTLVVKEVTGKNIKEALERSAQYFHLEEDLVTVSDRFMKPKVAHYNYDYYSGIDYRINLYKPVGSRVESILFKGKPIKDSHTYSLAMNNYRSSGTGGYDFYKDCPVIKDIQMTTTDMVTAYIRKHKLVTVDPHKYFTVISK